MDRGQAMLSVIREVYDGGKNLIPNWLLLRDAIERLQGEGPEGLKRYYEQGLGLNSRKGRWVMETLDRNGRKTLDSEYQRFMTIYDGSN
jgi:hypothetical protein